MTNNLEHIRRIYHRLRRKLYEAPQSLSLNATQIDIGTGRKQHDIERMTLIGQWLRNIGRKLKPKEFELMMIDDDDLSLEQKLKKYQEQTGETLTKSTYYYRKKRILTKVGSLDVIIKF